MEAERGKDVPESRGEWASDESPDACEQAEELDIPAITYANSIEIIDNTAEVQRHVDDFFEKLQMELPGLISVDLAAYAPRHLPLVGVEHAFENPDIRIMGTKHIGLEDGFNALKDSPTRIIDVYSHTAQKDNRVLKGAVKKIVDQLFDDYGKVIGGAMGKDLQTHDHEEAL